MFLGIVDEIRNFKGLFRCSSFFVAKFREYIKGIDLGKFIKNFNAENRYVPPKIALHIIGEACKALDHAHNMKDKITGLPLKIVHRDVSPSNIMITFSGDVKVIDFGIAKAEFDSRSTRTTTGQGLKGKYHYLSPEHGSKIEMDGRSDIYPLGAVLYETLTGAKLFDNMNTLELMNEARNAIIPIHKFESDLIPQEIKRIIKKAVVKDMDKRYQSAMAMHENIEAILQKLGAKPADLKRELSEIMSKFPVPDDDEFGADAEPTPLPTKIEFVPAPIMPPEPPRTPPTEITKHNTDNDNTATVTVAVPEPPRQHASPAQKPGNFKKAAAIVVAALAVAIIGVVLMTSICSMPEMKFQITSNLDSALVVVNGEPFGKTPAEFSWPLDRSFALALYRAGYDSVTGFYYRGKNDFQITDNARWQYEKRQDASMISQVIGNFSKNIYFKTTPVAATVFVDNDTTPLGMTNQDSIRLFIGARQIILRPNSAGYLDESFNLSVDAGLGNVVNIVLRRTPVDPSLRPRRITIVAQDARAKVIAPAKVANISGNNNAMLAVAVLGAPETRRNVQMGIQYRVKEFLPTPVEIELPSRAYKIKVVAPGGYLDKTLDIAPEQTGEVVFVLNKAPVKGVTIAVIDKITRLPILDGKVWFCKGKKKSDCLKEDVGFAGELFGELNAYGSYTRELKSGKYMFKIECAGYNVYITEPIELNSSVSLLTFELTRK